MNLQVPPAGGLTVHLVGYDHDDEADQMRRRTDLPVAVRSDESFTAATVHTPDRDPVDVPVVRDGDLWRVVVPHLGTYAIVHLR